jgi:hypothetical protein
MRCSAELGALNAFANAQGPQVTLPLFQAITAEFTNQRTYMNGVFTSGHP